MPDPPSLVLDVSVTDPCTGFPGLSIVALGAVLSIRRFVTGEGDVSLFPPASVATVRKSYRPSGTVVVSKETEYGAVASLAIVVQEPPLESFRWNATELTPEPPVSEAVALNAIVCRRFAPGASIALVGAAVSDLTTFVLVATATLPALSATR